MKISIINSSIRKDGRTAWLTNHFVNGLNSTNKYEINQYFLCDWNLTECDGCTKCWFKTKGICKFNDDFSKEISSIIKSDIIIFASPIWVGGGTYLLKIFIERLFSTLQPYFSKINSDKYGHYRNENNFIKTFLISTCALPGTHNFEPLITHIKSLDYLCNFTYSGELLKPQALELQLLNMKQIKILETNCFNTGKYFLSGDKRYFDFVENVARPFTKLNDYINFCNNNFSQLINHDKY